MKLGGIEIKPVALYLPDNDEWRQRAAAAKKYFAEIGIEDILWVAGIHSEMWGIEGVLPYLHDGVQDPPFFIGKKYVGGCLSVYIEWSICMNLPYDYFMFLEDDAVPVVENWKEVLSKAIEDAKETDWDWMFVGHCCAEDKKPVHVKGEVYSFPYRGEAMKDYYAMAFHCYIVKKRCLPFLIATNRNVRSPMDVSCIENSFTSMNVVAIIPRLFDQCNTELVR